MLLGVSGELLATTALGQPASGLTLRWQAPAGCPQQAAVRERIRTLTGATHAAPTALQAEGTITQTNSGHFHLKLVTRSGGLVGERNLDASSCENLTGAAAVSLALLMRSAEPPSESELAGGAPGAPAHGTATGAAPGTGSAASTNNTAAGANPATTSTATTSGNTGQNTPPAQTNSASQNAAAAAAAARKPSRTEAAAAADDSELPPSEIIERPIREEPGRKLHGLVQLPLAVMSIGALPQPSWGIGFAGGVSLDNWSLLLGGTAWLRQSVPSEQSADFGADIDRLTGTFRACHALGESRFEISPCLVLSLEHITARGTGVGVTSHPEQATWLAIGGGAQGRLNLTHFLALRVGLDAQIETASPVISVEGAGTVKQLGYAAFTATVGPEWIL